MNIFITDENPEICATDLCDKHIVKMVLESGQMLSTAHRLCNGQSDVYKVAYKNHPCTIWTRASASNYFWHYQLFVAMSNEYKHRYKKEHTTFTKLQDKLCVLPRDIPMGKLTPFACCMPDEYKISNNVILNYRWFITNKPFKKVWTNRDKPNWYNEFKCVDPLLANFAV